MSLRSKPDPYLVHRAGQILQNPRSATIEDAQRMAARILDDQEYDPKGHKPTGRKK
jgi:hypothetical protein